jgi:hypothetical protein
LLKRIALSLALTLLAAGPALATNTIAPANLKVTPGDVAFYLSIFDNS